jgi:5-formyltetrahydrofolate cyclo-ligase
VTPKQALRQQAESRRRNRPVAELDVALTGLLADARRVAAYLPVGSEPRVTVQPGWLLPVVTEDGDLDWAVHSGEVTVRRGLSEPVGPLLGRDALASCDLVLVPALLVATDGARLGKGAGCYDRALPRATGLTVALVGDEELVTTLPADAHDVRVAAVATPGRGVLRVPFKM